MYKSENIKIFAVSTLIGRHATGRSILVRLLLASALCFSPIAQSAAPLCTQNDSDPDMDGWGWENSASCVVAGSGVETRPGSGHPICVSKDSDSDGDGWGWENNKSCRVRAAKSQRTFCQSVSSDSDGDGWGWENNASCVVPLASDITDLILITGQSNTLGAGTAVDKVLDLAHARVFAFTSDGWQAARLYQTWDRNSFPGPGNAEAKSNFVYNNFALHFGKRLAELDPDRVVGFVLVSEPGEGIENWNPGSRGMERVQQKVTAAINDLPHKSALDGILWHQGETDWQFEGTSDPDVEQPAPINYYPARLYGLIANLRSENWFSYGKPFICGETIRAEGVNRHLRALNSDSDPYTACVAGFGLEATIANGSHFTASGLRSMGKWYADIFYKMTR